MTTKTADPRVVHVQLLEGSQQQAEVRVPDELQILDHGQEPEEHQGCLRFLTPEDGDKRVVWDRMKLPDITAARKMFEDFQQQGIRIFKVGETGGAVEEMTDFDALAEEFLADDQGDIAADLGMDPVEEPEEHVVPDKSKKAKQYVAMPARRIAGG